MSPEPDGPKNGLRQPQAPRIIGTPRESPIEERASTDQAATAPSQVRTLNYRTAIMRALLNDLRLRDRRDVLKDILEHAVPTTLQDVVIIFVHRQRVLDLRAASNATRHGNLT